MKDANAPAAVRVVTYLTGYDPAKDKDQTVLRLEIHPGEFVTVIPGAKKPLDAKGPLVS